MKKMSKMSIFSLVVIAALLCTMSTVCLAGGSVGVEQTFTFDDIALQSSTSPSNTASFFSSALPQWDGVVISGTKFDAARDIISIVNAPVEGNPDNKAFLISSMKGTNGESDFYAKYNFWGNTSFISGVSPEPSKLLVVGARFKTSSTDYTYRNFDFNIYLYREGVSGGPTTTALQFMQGGAGDGNPRLVCSGTPIVDYKDYINDSWYTMRAVFDPRTPTSYKVYVTDETGRVFTANPTINLPAVGISHGELRFRVRNNNGTLFNMLIDDVMTSSYPVYNYTGGQLVGDALNYTYTQKAITVENVSGGTPVNVTNGTFATGDKLRVVGETVDLTNLEQSPYGNIASLVVAVYDGDKLVDVYTKQSPTLFGRERFQINLDLPETVTSNHTVKAFMWSGVDQVKPLPAAPVVLTGTN